MRLIYGSEVYWIPIDFFSGGGVGLLGGSIKLCERVGSKGISSPSILLFLPITGLLSRKDVSDELAPDLSAKLFRRGRLLYYCCS